MQAISHVSSVKQNKSIKGCGELLGEILRLQAKSFSITVPINFSMVPTTITSCHYFIIFPSIIALQKFTFDYSSPLVIHFLLLLSIIIPLFLYQPVQKYIFPLS